MMKKYTANYAFTNPNFVIQNLIENTITDREVLPLLYVLKNLLQRGFPTTLSKYLQSHLGEVHLLDNFKDRFLFVDGKTPVWYNTIKGDSTNNYYPAKEFFEELIPKTFGEFTFVQSLIIPEIEITTIVGEEVSDFVNQQVDFYLPQAKLVIEIDGQQHKLNDVARISDRQRDNYLYSRGIATIRITTEELRNGQYISKVNLILEHLEQYKNLLDNYRVSYSKIKTNSISEIEKQTKLLPTAVIRFQILLLELLIHNYLTLKGKWDFNIFIDEDLDNFAELAIEDTLIWLEKLWQLKHKTKFKKPDYSIQVITDKQMFKPTTKSINIDFSVFKRYTDENKINEDILYVRTDYFDILKERNYFRVSATEPINYDITQKDTSTLEFFLQNLFDKPSFREGQFPIVSNALNRNDTIGLLPTGGGKSLCYQLACLLQPSVNFVVCPIKSLMNDQNENLRKMHITNVHHITSDFNPDERRKVEVDFEKGSYLFVWISPEKLQIPSFRDKLRSITTNFSIAYAVIDEVHCLSEWGHDFRTSYLNMAKTIDKLSPKDEKGEGVIKFLGLTATASVNVLSDIKIEFSRQNKKLQDENIKSLLDYSRKELVFNVINDNGNKRTLLQNVIQDFSDKEDFVTTTEKSAIIFTPNVNGQFGCYPVSSFLNTLYQDKSNWYSGKIPQINQNGIKIDLMEEAEFKKHKENVQQKFKNNEYPLLVATKAFGMGIDKDNIHYTIHYGLPSSVEALYQEAGRAGRWDKNKEENKNKEGKCIVLYSPETINKERVERLFHLDTTFSEIKKISQEAGWSGQDVFRQIFLFLQGQKDIDEEAKIVIAFIHKYFKNKTVQKIYWQDAQLSLGIDEDVLQKVIYRLSLLGIVADWTTDFKTHFEVEFDSCEEKSVIKHISNHINKYQIDRDVTLGIYSMQKDSFLEKAVYYLLNWIFEGVVYNRKQSLKTLVDWCHEFKDSDSFKRRIDNYFKFTDTTFLYQHISETPNDYKRWFEIFTIRILNNQNEITKEIFIPEISNLDERKKKFEELRDGLSRFLERGIDNTGLNLLSGLIRLFLNQYQDSDGIERFEKALSNIKQFFIEEEQIDILERVKQLGYSMNEKSKYDMCLSILKFYPEYVEDLANDYDLPYLLADLYAERITEVKQLNKKLYEQLAEI